MQLRQLSRLEKQGVIQAFEYAYELAWNTLEDFLLWQGIVGIVGSGIPSQRQAHRGRAG